MPKVFFFPISSCSYRFFLILFELSFVIMLSKLEYKITLRLIQHLLSPINLCYKMKRNLLLFLLLTLLSLKLFSQGAPACPTISAGSSSASICNGQCTSLTSAVVSNRQTTGYTVGAIPYVPYAYAGTPILVGLDDVWGPSMNVGFNFCYFGNVYNQIVVGANGQVTFDLTQALAPDFFPITTTLPNSSDMPGNTICALFRDINPALGGTIYYETVGIAPCRALVISWVNIPLYDKGAGTCDGTPNSTFQVVLYENTNYIDVYVQNSFSCSGWNGGYGIIGLQDAAASTGITAPGRNYPTPWTTTNEAWRFAPSGIPSYNITWTGPSGIIGTGASVSVCPTTNTTYTATMLVTDCNGANTSYSSTETITVTPAPTVTVVPAAPTICPGGSVTLTANGATTYTWSPAANLNTTNGTTVIANPPSTTTYTVTGTGAGCPGKGIVTVTTSLPVAPVISGVTSLCNGNSTTLTASGAGAGGTYSWNTGALTSVISVTPGSTTTYTVTATNAAGCTGKTTQSVTLTPLPSAAISGTTTLCKGASTTMSGSGGGTYSWSTGATTSSIVVSPANTTSYTLTVTNAAGCSASTTQVVTVNSNPIPVISSGAIALCNGANTTLTGSGGGTYSWNTGATTSSIVVSPASTTSYTLVATNATGCSASTTQVITVNSNPIPVISSGTTTLCNGANTTLTGSGGGTYSWNTGATSSSISVSPASTTIYTLTVTNAVGCKTSTTQSITVNSNPVPAISSVVTTLCSGANTTLTGSGGGSYSWNTGATTSSIVVSPVSTTSYTLTVTNATGCSASTTQVVTVNSNPIPVISSGTTTLCNGANTTLTGSGGGTYSWNTGSTSSSISVSPSSTTTYTLTVTNAAGCSAFATQAITVHPNPLPVISSGASSICSGTTTTLTASGGGTYSWNTGASTSSISISPPNTTIYTLTVTNVWGCNASITQAITVNSNPVPVISSAATAICTGTNTTLTASGGGAYSWNTGATTTSISVSPSATTTYTLTIISGTGCISSAVQVVTVNSLPVLTISETDANCGTGNGSATTNVTNGFSPYIYSWSSGQITQTATGLAAGTYTVSVFNSNGCIQKATIQVNNIGAPIAILQSFTDPMCHGSCSGAATVFASGGAPGYTYLWIPSPGAGQGSASVSQLCAGTYTCQIKDIAGCQTQQLVTILQPQSLTITATQTNIHCNGGNSGSASVSTMGGTPGYSYSWNSVPVQLGATATGLTQGSYACQVSDSNGCVATQNFTLLQPLPLIASAISQPATCSLNNGSITLSPSGGTPGSGYTYSWNPLPAAGQVTASATALSANIYTCTVKDSLGCSLSLIDTVKKTGTLPQLSISGTRSICVGTSTILTASGGSTYSWSNGGFTTDTLSVSTAGTYTVTATNSCGSVNDTASIKVNPLPVANISGQTNFCSGSSTILIASGGTSYSWNPGGATTSYIPVSSTGTYTVTALNSCGSSNSKVTVTVHNVVAHFTSNPNSGIAPVNVLFSDNSTGALLNWSWNFGEGGTGNGLNQNYTFTQPGTYTITETVTDSLGCTDTFEATIVVHENPSFITVPNVFTPNGDGDNDAFSITSSGIVEISTQIFDRWGVLIAQLTSVGEYWDGRTTSGLPATAGTYYYLIRAKGADGKDFNLNGFLMLIR
jgi:gliding motility-associated-like protein